MGTSPSRYESTNWDEVDGGMHSDYECLAGNKPTSAKKTVTLAKKERLNMREYECKDQNGNLICVTVPILETGAWFELHSPSGQKLCRAKKLVARNAWLIFSYLKPAFEGQGSDPEARRLDVELTATGTQPMYRTYRVEFDLSKSKATLKSYKIDVVEKRGVPGEPVLTLERVGGRNEAFQTSLPNQEPLVSYWEWKDNQIELEVAKGTDLALHILLAVLVNVVREFEKNPVGWIFH